MPERATAGRARGDEEHPQVRFAFKLSRVTLRAIKQVALDRDVSATDLVHEWVATGLAGGYDEQRARQLPRQEPTSQFPVMLTPQERRALHDRCIEDDLSGAQLVRRWVAHGLHGAQAAADTPPGGAGC